MKIFMHHIYEYRKGLRKMVLYTGPSGERAGIVEKLGKHEISYIISDVSSEKINVFFGAEECIGVLKNFNTLELDKLSAAEDFILGSMLGYDLIIQCRRFLKRGISKNTSADNKSLYKENVKMLEMEKIRNSRLEKDIEGKIFILNKYEKDIRDLNRRVEELELNELLLREEIDKQQFGDFPDTATDGRGIISDCDEEDEECGCFDMDKCRYREEVDSIRSTVNLENRTFLLVGGRKKLKEYCREIVESGGGIFMHHDGGMEDSKKKLPSAALKADVVICALDCISHSACRSMKKICKKENKNILYLKNTSVNTLNEQIKAVC